MITKKVYAQYLIDEFKYKNNIPYDTPNNELNMYVPQSTSLGIGLETLGNLDNEYKEYISNRSGRSIINTISQDIDMYPDKMKAMTVRINHYSDDIDSLDSYFNTHNLSVRELMNLLPED